MRCCAQRAALLAEWLHERGIGEDRAALIEDGDIAEMLIERHDRAVRLGTIFEARLIKRIPNSDRAIFELSGGEAGEAIGQAAARLCEGQRLRVAVIREAIPEAGNPKAPTVRVVDDAEMPSSGPSLLDRLRQTGHPVKQLFAHDPDLLEQNGWSERLGQAESGLMPFEGGLLRIAITPAMTLIDVDGALMPAELARLGAAAAAGAIRLFDIGGSVGLDLPVPRDGNRQLKGDVAARIDAILPQPFERTALNGFGFLQIVRPRLRASIPELIQSDRVTGAALALLRRAERAGGRGALTLAAAPAVIRRIARESAWRAELTRRRGAAVHLSEREGAAISAGDATAEFP